MTEIPQYKIGRFNVKNNVTENQRVQSLVNQAISLESGYVIGSRTDEQVANNLAQIIFDARCLAELRDINISSELVDLIDDKVENGDI